MEIAEALITYGQFSASLREAKGDNLRVSYQFIVPAHCLADAAIAQIRSKVGKVYESEAAGLSSFCVFRVRDVSSFADRLGTESDHPRISVVRAWRDCADLLPTNLGRRSTLEERTECVAAFRAELRKHPIARHPGVALFS